MAFDHLSREGRRAAAAYAKAAAKKRPAKLTEIPAEDWPASMRNARHAPTHAWESQKYLVQMFDEDLFQGIDTRRITVSRVTLNDAGHWDENLTWDELMQAKRDIGFGHWYAVEIYPRDIDIVNVANMRHLWMLAVPLELGWFSAR